MQRCVFCRIAKGEAPAYVVYRSETTIAFLDILPLTRGHTLVIPKNHYRDLFEAPDEVLYELIRSVKVVAKALLKALEADGVRIVQNNGSAAGQEIFHLHFHVIPFYWGLKPGRRPLRSSEGERIARLVAATIQET